MGEITYGPGDDLPRDRRGLVGLGRSSSSHRTTMRVRGWPEQPPRLRASAETRPYPIYAPEPPGPGQ